MVVVSSSNSQFQISNILIQSWKIIFFSILPITNTYSLMMLQNNYFRFSTFYPKPENRYFLNVFKFDFLPITK